MLYIANTVTATPLIYGDFSQPYLEINGGLVASDMKVPYRSYSMPTKSSMVIVGPYEVQEGVVIEVTAGSTIKITA